MQGALVVDSRGGTSDPRIWAGGSATRLGRWAVALHLGEGPA